MAAPVDMSLKQPLTLAASSTADKDEDDRLVEQLSSYEKSFSFAVRGSHFNAPLIECIVWDVIDLVFVDAASR